MRHQTGGHGQGHGRECPAADSQSNCARLGSGGGPVVGARLPKWPEESSGLRSSLIFEARTSALGEGSPGHLAWDGPG